MWFSLTRQFQGSRAVLLVGAIGLTSSACARACGEAPPAPYQFYRLDAHLSDATLSYTPVAAAPDRGAITLPLRGAAAAAIDRPHRPWDADGISLSLRAGQSASVVWSGLTFDAREYALLTVPVETSPARAFSIAWEGDGLQRTLVMPTAEGFREYEIDAGQTNSWKYISTPGQFDAPRTIRLTFEGPANIRLTPPKLWRREFSRASVVGLYRNEDLSDQSRESVFLRTGADVKFPVALSSRPYFRFGVSNFRDGASLTYRVLARDPASTAPAAEVATVTHTSATAWQDFDVSLERWRGKSIELTLQLDGGADEIGFFSAPIVYERNAILPRSVVVYVVDALRADHAASPQMPFLADLTARHVSFARSYSAANCTSMTVPALFTGMSYMSLRVPSNPTFLPEAVDTLAEHFKNRGYATIQLTANWNSYTRGNGQGFDYMFHVPDAIDPAQATKIPQPDMPARLREVLAREAGRPLFIYVHTDEVHPPYYPSREDVAAVGAADYDGPVKGDSGTLRQASTKADFTHVRRLYQASARMADRQLRQFFSLMAEDPRLRDPLMAITADHGQALHDVPGLVTHCLPSVRESLLSVPLVLVGTGVQARVEHALVSSIDLFPTMLAELGESAAVPRQVEGLSLTPLYRQDAGTWSRDVLTVGDERKLGATWSGDYKLVAEYDSGRLALYNLRDDPGERRNVLGEYPDVAARLSESRARYLADAGKTHSLFVMPKVGVDTFTASTKKVRINPDQLDALRALGYVK